MWFTRYGQLVSSDAKINVLDKNRATMTEIRKCDKCGGQGGSSAWARTGWTCYKCGGSGTLGMVTVKLYTMEKIEKMDAAQDKRQAKKEAAKREKIAAAIDLFKSNNPEAYSILINKDIYHDFINDMRIKLHAGGTFTEKMINAINKFKPRPKTDVVPIVEGRHEIVGKVIKSEIKETRFGDRHVITIKDAEGRCYWGTCPKHIDPEEIDKIHTMTATVSVSDRSETFGFFKRPAK